MPDEPRIHVYPADNGALCREPGCGRPRHARTCRRNYQRQWEQSRKQDPEYLERRRAQERARYQARKEAARGR